MFLPYCVPTAGIRIPPFTKRNTGSNFFRCSPRRCPILPFHLACFSISCRFAFLYSVNFCPRIICLNSRERKLSREVLGTSICHRSMIIGSTTAIQIKSMFMFKYSFRCVPRLFLCKRQANNVMSGRVMKEVRLFRYLLYFRRNMYYIKVRVNFQRVVMGRLSNRVINLYMRRLRNSATIRFHCVSRSWEVRMRDRNAFL